MKYVRVIGAVLALSAGVMAGEEPADYPPDDAPQRITVTATRIPTPVRDIAEPITVFTGGQPGKYSETLPAANAYTAGNFEARQYRSILDVVRQSPGVSEYTSGGAGTLSGLSMRGLQPGNTQMVVDGMPMNDPGASNGMFDFGVGALDNIGQMEILRGPQSALYGTSATGGVVNMTSMKGEGPFSGYVSAEAGSRGTAMTRFGASAGTDRGDFSFSGTLLHTDGFSVADKRYGNTEKDRYRLGSFGLRLGFNVGDNLRFDLFAHGLRAEKELDASPPWGVTYPPTIDDGDYKMRTERMMIRPQVTLSTLDGRWEHVVGFGYAQTNQRYYDDDLSMGDFMRTKFVGETTKLDYKSIFRIHETNTLIAGVDVVTDSMKKIDPWYGPLYDDWSTFPPGKTQQQNDKFGSVTSVGVFIEDRINIADTFFANAGLRQEHHDKFGEHTAWKTSAMYVFPTNTKLKASAGTGFKAPTLQQLYITYPDTGWGGYYANPDLDPERTFGWDVGAEQSLFCDKVVFGSTFFRNKVKNYIESVPVGGLDYRYENIRSYRTWGLESFVNIAITDNLILSAQHTWLRTEGWPENESAVRVRRPRHTFSVNVDYTFLEKGTLTAGVRHVGKRTDAFNGDEINMPSYAVARFGAAWKVNDRFEIFGRVENAFNKKHQELYGYGTERIGFFGGLTVSF